jgi:Rieske Fe-S protein
MDLVTVSVDGEHARNASTRLLGDLTRDLLFHLPERRMLTIEHPAVNVPGASCSFRCRDTQEALPLSAVDPITEPAGGPRRGRSRRDVLCGLAVALIAPGALVAACGDDSGEETRNADAGPTPLADIPDGGGLVVDNPAGGKALLVRNGQQVLGYNASCTHMGSIVGVPKNGVSTCPNHGSKFDVGDGGKVVNGPATKPLRKISVRVDAGKVVIT